MPLFKVTFHLQATAETVESLAASILVEQTVETPLTVARSVPFTRDHLMGRREALIPDALGGYFLTLSLPCATASADPAQILNVLFGNVSLHDRVRLYDFDWPTACEAPFKGPQFGIEGIRHLTGVTGRALTCAALKPVGLDVEAIGRLCRTLASAGLDLIKDDHYLADHPFCPFEERVRTCLSAVDDIAMQTGRQALYVPNLSGTPEQVLHQADFAQRQGAQAVMAAPFLIGLPFFSALTEKYLSVPILAHPSFAGSARIHARALFGKLIRLYGADAVIFTNYGGRFSYPKEECLAIAGALRSPLPPFRPAFPVPAGGMEVAQTPALLAAFGPETILLIGGNLFEAGNGLYGRAKAFADAVADTQG